MEEDADDSCSWGSNIRASPDIPVRLQAMQWHSFPFSQQQPICCVRKRAGFGSPTAASNTVVLPKAVNDPLHAEPVEERRALSPARCPCCSAMPSACQCHTGKGDANLTSSPLIREDLRENLMERWKRPEDDLLTLYNHLKAARLASFLR